MKDKQIVSMVLAGVCCNHLLMSGIDYKLVNGKLSRVKGKEAYLINDFLKRIKELHKAIGNSIDYEKSGITLDDAGDSLDEEMPDEQDAIDLLGYCLENLKGFKSLKIRNAKIALKRLNRLDLDNGKVLFKAIIEDGKAGGMEVEITE